MNRECSSDDDYEDDYDDEDDDGGSSSKSNSPRTFTKKYSNSSSEEESENEGSDRLTSKMVEEKNATSLRNVSYFVPFAPNSTNTSTGTANDIETNETAQNSNQNHIQFSRSSVGGSKYLINAHVNVTVDSPDLIFESRFESGNLAKAIKITPVYYELYLRSDLYTNKHNQWFYFRVTKTKKNVPYRWVESFAIEEWNDRVSGRFILQLFPAQILHREFGQIG